MKGSKIPKISEAEWSVMEVLWARGALRSAEIVEALGQHPKTVSTYLGRLVKKGAVAGQKEGRWLRYRASVVKEDCQAAVSESFLDKVFGGSLVPMLTHFVRSAPMSDTEIESLRKILDERKRR